MSSWRDDPRLTRGAHPPIISVRDDEPSPVSKREVAVSRGLDILTGSLALGALAAMVNLRTPWFLAFWTLGVLAQLFRSFVSGGLGS